MTTDSPRRPPVPLLLALFLVVVEAGALLAQSVGMLVEVLGGRTQSTAFATVLALVFIGIVLLLLAAVRALFQGRRWGRGPVVTTQLLVFAIGASQGLLTWTVALLMAVPVAVTVGLLVPASVEWTNRPTPPRTVV